MRGLWCLLALGLGAQEVPVVLLNGYQRDCGAAAEVERVFGQMPELLASEGWRVHYFNQCEVRGRDGQPTIEELGVALGKFVEEAGLKEFDAVGYSMGGLVLRAYLAGKQPEGGWRPPERVRIRRAVFLATPHMGAVAQAGALVGREADGQQRAMFQGSSFLGELAGWTQDSRQLRGVEALAVVGDGGPSRAHDGVVSLVSGAWLKVLGEDRVRVLPYCHEESLPGWLCRGLALAKVNGRQHLSYRVVESFLRGNDNWRRIGEGPRQSRELSRFGGIHLVFRQADNQPAEVTRTTLMTGRLSGELLWNSEGGFFADRLPVGEYELVGRNQLPARWVAEAGHYPAVVIKSGPAVRRVFPDGILRPGMRVRIEGLELAGSQALLNGEPVELEWVDEHTAELLLPEATGGLLHLRLESAGGVTECGLMVEEGQPR